jgi:DNA-binding beta-propeller fold protein YncE
MVVTHWLLIQIIKILITTAEVTLFAGTVSSSGTSDGFGTNCKFNGLYDVQVSFNGEFALVADTNSHTIRKIVISTIQVTTLVDNSASLNFPGGVSISDDDSYALITDTESFKIRKLIISMHDHHSCWVRHGFQQWDRKTQCPTCLNK